METRRASCGYGPVSSNLPSVSSLASSFGTTPFCPIDLPPIVVPLATRVLEPWTKGEAERSPEAMVLLFQELEADSLASCAA